MLLLLTVLLGVAGIPSSTQSQTAESLLLDLPSGVATVSNGDVYISQRASGVILRVLPSGRSERVAQVQEPTHLAAAPDGTLVFVDASACRICGLAPDGVMTHLVGTGRCATAAGGPGGGSPLASRRALQIDLATIGGLAFDSTGRLYFSDETNHAVRRVDADGFVRTFAGNGFAALGGDGEAATDAYLNTPRGLAFDTEGRLYIADAANCRIRRVTTDAKIETAAGNTCAQTNSASNVPGRLSALAYDAGQNAVYVASPGTARILRFDVGSSRLTVALGNGNRRTPDVAAPLTTSIDEPSGLAIASFACTAKPSESSPGAGPNSRSTRPRSPRRSSALGDCALTPRARFLSSMLVRNESCALRRQDRSLPLPAPARFAASLPETAALHWPPRSVTPDGSFARLTDPSTSRKRIAFA